MIKNIPNGVYPTMITPYTTDNKIDYNAVEQLLYWYKERNVKNQSRKKKNKMKETIAKINKTKS